MAEAKSKRPRILTRLFLHDDGSTTPRSKNDVNTVIFKFEDETEVRFPLAPIFGGTLPAPGVGRAAAAFGINTSAGNTIGTLDKDEDGNVHPDDVKVAVEDRLATFTAGRWSEESAAGGPGTSLRLETMIKFRKDVNGKDADDAWKTAMRAKLEDDKEFWKNLMGDPAFRTVHEALKAERAASRAKAAAEKSKGLTSTLQL